MLHLTEGRSVSPLAWLILYGSRLQFVHGGWLLELILELDALLVPLGDLLLMHMPKLL